MGCGSSVSRHPDSKAASTQTSARPSDTGRPIAGPESASQPAPAVYLPPTPQAQGLKSTNPSQPPPSQKPESARKATSLPADQRELPLQTEVEERACELTTILAQKLQEEQQRAEEERKQSRRGASSLSIRSYSSSLGTSSRRRAGVHKSGGEDGTGGAGDSGGGLADELEALMGAGDRFQELLRDIMATAQTQILLPGDANPEDAANLQAASGCTMDQAVRFLDCLAVVRAAADALSPPIGAEPDLNAIDVTDLEDGPKEDGPTAKQAATGTPAAGATISPSPQQLTRQLGTLASLVNDVPGLRTAAMARGAADPLLRILLHNPERTAAANAALVLAGLAAGPPPHKTALISAGIVGGLLQAARGHTAAAKACGGDAPVVAANSCSALGNLATGHAAGAAALAAATGGIETLVSLLDVGNAPNIRTNAAGVLVQITGTHELYRAAVVAAGAIPALAAGMLRGPEAPACNAVTALYNLTALTPPTLRPALAQPGGPMMIIPQLLLCMAGRNATGAADESVAAASSARVNASAVLLELCKDPTSAPLLGDASLAVTTALAAMTAGRLPPPPPAVTSTAAESDISSGGVDLLYPVPSVVRGNCLLSIMALARMGPVMQLELGRCGAVGTLLQLLEPGEDPAMQVNSANAICSLAAANPDIHAALVASRCVPLLAGLLTKGGDAARANVAAVLVTMMRDQDARQQIQECGAISSLVRLIAALLDERFSLGASSASGSATSRNPSADPSGVLCNSVGALAEAAKYSNLRLSMMQMEFGEALGILLRCLKEAPEPAQVNAAAALCHLCREQSAAVQLGRLRGVELLKEAVGARPDESNGGAPMGSWTRPSSRLRHNASRALARLQEQLSAADEEMQAKAAPRSAEQAAAATTAGAPAVDVDEAPMASGAATEFGGESDIADQAPASSTRRSEPPRSAWDLSNTDEQAVTSSRVLEAVTSYKEDDVDNLNMVITPPLPLAAF